MDKRAQPKWNVSEPSSCSVLPELSIFNSLSSKKEKFVPERDTTVRWYTCGPTVYDISHMGHARTYLAFDILRRIFRDYFLFNVIYVLNITDVDDKIIKRARQTHLFEEYLKSDHTLDSVYTDISKAIRVLKEKSITDPDPDKRHYLERESERLISLLGSPSPSGEDPVGCLIKNSKDALSDVLDRELGASITDHKIFESLARHYEEEYHKDMKSLNILEPDVLVRVTESIEPIIRFVQKIIANGFAYVAPSGSVYFDTNRFANDPKHFYAKLVPTAFGDQEQLATGEGELSIAGEKRSANDFALWKASKGGEPSWPSPWGAGRPGWHIECSVMASAVFGDSMEIHGGGIDLRFPHHDNELAQSEAHFGHSHWVRYFLHAGHLTISGCKMSKSLKNFVSIRDALKEHSARRLRLTFLLHSWRDTIDYSADTLTEAASFEKMVIDFLYNASNLQLMAGDVGVPSDSSALSDNFLITHLAKLQKEVYNSFCDSCDTRRAMAVVKELVTLADQYALVSEDPPQPIFHRANQVYLAASFVLRLLRVLGVADLTLASAGTPVPVGAIVAGGTLSADARPIHFELDVSPEHSVFLSRSWLSLDAPTVDLLSSSLYTGLLAAQTMGNIMLREGGPFIDLAKDFARDVQSTYGLDVFNLPEMARDCLELCVRNVKSRSLSELSHVQFGLESDVWPVVCGLLRRIASMRESVRYKLLAGTSVEQAVKQRLLSACDRMRDEDFVTAGIRLQDRSTAASLARGTTLTPFLGIVDPVVLAEEISAKTKRDSERRSANIRQPNAKLEAGRLPPSEMFLSQHEKYSAFDDKGIPTHDAEGKELSKSQLKKLLKLYDAQSKRYNSFLKQKHAKENGQ